MDVCRWSVVSKVGSRPMDSPVECIVAPVRVDSTLDVSTEGKGVRVGYI